MSTQRTICRSFLALLFVISIHQLSGEGSKNVTPSATGTATAVNNFIGYLEHDVDLAGEPFYFESGAFLQAGAPADERVYVHIRAGESLHWGLRRIVAPGELSADYEDLHVILYDGSDAEVARWTIEGSATAAFPAGAGVITDHAEALAGPQQIVGGATGYDANTYTNSTGLDQNFYVVFIQTDLALSGSPTEAEDIDLRSNYDIWDFSVFNGLEEKPGRLFCKKWNFTAYAAANLFSENFQLYVRIPSDVGGSPAGSYVKQLDLAGIQPFSVNFYANDVGHIGSDFTLQRQSQNAENAALGYDIFISNPDLDVYPTTALPTINITNAIFDCSGTGGSGYINFVTNQVGQIALILNLNGQSGYQANTSDVIIEAEVEAIGTHAIRWNGLDGLGGVVASGAQIDISGRFTSAPLHAPMWDVEENDEGIQMVDIRPATSFDLIYWDDPLILGLESNPNSQLTGTNVNPHIWGGGTQEGNNISTNTWSFGYYQINSQLVDFEYECDADGDNVANNLDEDGDNDGISDEQEGYMDFEYKGDADADNIPNYLDPEFVNFVDSNLDGVNDNFDSDFDGVPNALDLDSDNDGIPDVVEAGLADSDNDGRLTLPLTDAGTANGWDDAYDDSQGGTPLNLLSTNNDFDQDGISNFQDLDSDNDGIVDTYEAGGLAGDEGRISGFLDSDRNGRNDTQDIGALALPDTDADGTLPDYLDVDSDNDGITDNIEAQASNAIIESQAGDSDGNGLLDVYDPSNDGMLLQPVDTDTDENADYVDLDSDQDGIVDLIEGHDGNSNGFADWDSSEDNNDITDESGHDTDTDLDGLLDLFESSIATIQNSDDAGLADWQDTDDDNDGIPTAGEDFNNNDDWTDDLTQGGVTVPDYLFRGDYDSDGVIDTEDLDDDNDGILDANEPGDTDNDGIINSLDLDSDNDGILDAIEANSGAIPNGFNQATGQFNLNDPDEDGLMNAIDNTPGAETGASTLPNLDSDGDGLNDFLDIDSDGDGITDFYESMASTSTLTFSFTDNDGDGLDDAFDPNQGGSLMVPINTDGADNPDYLDNDSDNDGVPDVVEGDDQNTDGYGDWDADQMGDTNELNADTDDDGLDDVFDTSAIQNGNALGTDAARQNTDSVGEVDYRDDDDDNDGNPTSLEDNGDEVWTNDFTEGQTGVPDYLFFGDFDGDGQPDIVDTDTDNDGLLDFDESNGQTINPSADEDGDNIPNFRDTEDPDVTSAIDVTDANGDGVYDVFDSDLDGLPDFKDSDSDNDGIGDLVESGGVDIDGNGQVDDPTDSDNDGLADTFDFDNEGTPLLLTDKDVDGLIDAIDLDADNDGLPDLLESGGQDSNHDGRVDFLDDNDGDGFVDAVDTDGSGMNLTLVDSDGDLILDIHDKDSDNDGITDVVEFGGTDSDGDGEVDGADTDSDGDGLADVVDPDAGGSPLSLLDSDGDLIPNARDLDSDNDGYQDILEGEGIDANGDGIVSPMEDDFEVGGDGIPNSVDVSDTGGNDVDMDGIDDLFDTDFLEGIDTEIPQDGIPDVVDVDQTGGEDADTDGIDNLGDVDFTGGTDIDGDGIDDNLDPDKDGDGIENAFDPDANGDGYDDATEEDPMFVPDFDSDGLRDYVDLDSDGDGLTDVVEFDETPAAASGQIEAFTDSNMNGWNDAQETTQIVPPNTDGDAFPTALANYIDLDSDDDGIVDNYEAQSSLSYLAPSGSDSDLDGLDDAYDPNANGTLILPVNSDGADQDDYLDDDSDNDAVSDLVEGNNAGRGQYADWDSNQNALFDDPGFNEDTDDDGILDIFDNYAGTGASQITGSGAAVQDTDHDGIDDFRDIDDDNDTDNTIDEDDNANNDPSDDSGDSGGLRPNYLYAIRDADGDGVFDDGTATRDLDADNDGLANDQEDGGIGIDPSADIETVPDGILNYEDSDWDNDGILNVNDSDADGDANPDTFSKEDSNNDGVIDVFDHDLDGVPDFLDRDSDNDGISDAEELSSATGFNDPDLDGQIDDDGSYADSDTDGMEDTLLGGITVPDTDSDGIPNHLDLDSDNDGITDNREGETTANYTAPTMSDDDDGDGILNVYDETFLAGNSIIPANTDGPDANPDYVDTDSDDDGVLDEVEAFDANADGFSDLDADTDGSLSDEFGHNADSDSDGILNIFDTTAGGFTSIENIDGSSQGLQDTDNDDEADFRDVDDDGDGINTSAEDTNPNDGNWTNDFAQGGITVPDYLFSPDLDGDLVADDVDLDSDQDGVLNADEFAGTTYDVGSDGSAFAGTPFGDSDGDGLYNYLDASDMNFTITDQNGDDVDDRVDQDRDGIPNFFDLDSDNDGILDGIEANSGIVPAGFSTTTGRFGTDNSGNPDDDTDGDGVNNAGSIAPVDLDADGLADYLDLDSDNDGISDLVEAQTTPFALGSGVDSDSDGLDDTFDANNGGSTITPTNTDGADEFDYRDTDSDQDGVLDRIEGHDENQNGFADWDTNVLDNDPSNEDGVGLDTDNDGIENLYDAFSGYGANNVNGTIAALQDTDGDLILDFRDDDDDDDGLDTSDNTMTTGEDQDDNGIWTNDFTQGGGSTPNYLYAGADRDGDGFSDASDLDSDNDGVPDNVENTSGVDPFGDLDNDGTFNYLDQDDANGLADSNADGVNDVFDFDLDGVPNFFDLDSDNDGITDHEEAGGTDDGADGNQGILDNFIDTTPDDGQDDDTSLTALDFDGDGQPNFLDLDSDNDGVQDIVEAGGSDSSSPADGYGDTPGDSDGDGLLNLFESTPLAVSDQDGDNLNNYIDLDSDNDGIPDLVEAGGTDTDGNGLADTFTDGGSNNGWSNIFEGGSALASPDTDNDGLPDAFDLDSDGDGIPDVAEANTGVFPAEITDFDGRYPYSGNDSDINGFVNFVDTDNTGTPLAVPDTDTDGVPDFQDTDSDADGSPDYIEAFDDDRVDSGLPANDALHDYLARADAYGVANAGDPSPYINATDTDTDGIPNWLEGNPPNFLNPNNDTYYSDVDSDGIVDLFDTDVATSGVQYGGVADVPDNNVDGTPNQLDDSDVITLPVELIYFDGKQVKNEILLSWQTASELNNALFIVEKSNDEKVFKKIGEVNGNGTSNQLKDYQFSDQNPSNGANYYRLLQVDYDGRSELSRTIVVIAEVEDLVIDIFPNPTSDQFSIRLSKSVTDLAIRLNNLSGSQILEKRFNDEGINETNIDVSGLKKGVYILSLSLDGKTKHHKLVIDR